MTFAEYFAQDGALSKSEIARLVDLTPSAIGHYANGRRTPSQADAARIAQACGEPSLYEHWYPPYEEQLERMLTTGTTAPEDRAHG